MKAILIAFASLLIVAAHGQTFCQKYSAALGLSQVALINATVEYTFNQLYANPKTQNWFNGVYNGIDFGNSTNAALAQQLKDHLIGFFGTALGCNDTTFVQNYGSGFSTDMTAVHSGFTRLVDKSAFETFNQIILDFLYAAGVSIDDRIAVASVLDGFRARAPSPNKNQVCQFPDCEMAPYSVNVGDSYFNPPYVSVPNGGSIAFVKVASANPHTVTTSSNGSACVVDASPVFNFNFDGSVANGSNITTGALTVQGSQDYISTVGSDCSTASMRGTFVVGAPPPPTLCQKYTAIIFGSDNLNNEIALMNTTVLAAFSALYADPATKPWFDGTNNGIDFGSDTTAANNLVNHLIAFFGAALGCVAPGFSTAFPVANPNMTQVHSVFSVPITKAAYERFNQILLDFLKSVNMTTPDLITVASVLDGFRARTSGGNPNQVCQASDCTTAPYTVLVRDNYFNPAYITVPTGGSINFMRSGSRSHTATEGTGPEGNCTVSNPSFDIVAELGSSAGPNGNATQVFNNPGLVNYVCKFHCDTSDMYAQINVVGNPISTQTFCQKYTAALFGNDTLQNEISLMNTTVLAAFSALYADPATKPWFDGTNNGIDFGSDTTAANNLVNHLIAFFGAALGCVAPGFSTAFPVANPNMTQVHSVFSVPITKAAYERFNQILLNFLVRVGVSMDDAYSIAQVLDGFRARNPANGNLNQVCQASDCTTSPYTVLLSDSPPGSFRFFNPPYISLPTGGQIAFVKEGTAAHTATQGVAPVGTCTAPSSPLFDISFNGTVAQGTAILTPPLNQPGELDYFCRLHCASTDMWGAINVVGAPVGPPTFCQKYAAALFGADNAVTEASLINATVQYAVPKLYTDPATAAWFNGTNNGIDFGSNAAALQNLVNHLIGFFGAALGCNAPGFSTAYPVSTPDMTGVHGAFRVPINKAAYERFNQILIDFLNIAGCDPADVYAVAQALDGFRAKATTGPNLNQVCQAADCTTPPYTVQVTDKYFNPPFYTLPLGGNIAFQKQSGGTQTFSTVSGSVTNCAFDATPAFSLSVNAASANGTTVLSPAFQGIGNINYGENSKCATGMYGTISVIGATPTAQTFCQKYTTALFGVDNAANEAALINATVQYAVPKLYTDPATAAWFNGANNGIDFGSNAAALQNLVNHLIGFFGFALGCTASGFSTNFPVSNPNMTAVHSVFRVPINKAAYERFNQILLDFLAIAGVTPADRLAVASALDSFRAPMTGQSNTNQVCQAADCTTPPYEIRVQDNYYNPPYLTVPAGGRVQFVKQAANAHTVVQSSGPTGSCGPVSSPTFNITSFTAAAANGTTGDTGAALSSPGTVWFTSTTPNDCSINGMYGAIMVMPTGSQATVIVGAGNTLTFSPNALTLTAPATITFMWDAANLRQHTVTSQGATQCVPGGIQSFSSNLQSSGTFVITLTQAGVYPFFCDPHCGSGMRGTITITGGPTAPPVTAGPTFAPATPPPPGSGQILVGGPGVFAFNPSRIVVSPGTTVTWTWAPGNAAGHNIVSQAGPGQCTNGGPEQLMPAGTPTQSTPGTTFTHTFNTEGNFYYFCQPHCLSGMEGIVTVVRPGGTTVPLASTPPPATAAQNNQTNCYTNPNGVMTICWEVANGNITFTVTGKTKGWIATGVSDDANMPQSDIFWGQVDSVGAVVIDRYADARAQPPEDKQQDLTLIPSRSNETNGITTIAFTRRLITQPPDNRDIDITDRDIFLMWAYSDVDATRVGKKRDGTQPDQFSFQQHLTSGTVKVNLISGAMGGNVKKQDKLRKAHGILMILAWALCSIVGTFIARYFKALMGDGWFQSHRIIQMLCVILNLIGFILIVVWVGRQGVKHFRAPHQRLGLVILILSIIQPLLGFLADKLFNPNRKGTPIFPDILHWLVGYGIVILGLVNVWLGLSIYCVTHLAAMFFAFIVGVTIIGFTLFEVMRIVAPWGGFLGSHSKSRGEPAAVLALLAALMAILIFVFSIIIASEVGKEDSGNPHAYYKNCIVTELTGTAYYIRLIIYLTVGAAAGAVCLLLWIWRGKKSQNYELALEGGALYHALEH